MEDRLPLSALLSQVLVAFVIEFDNEFEHLVPHRTTNHGATGGTGSPWLVSMAMWVQLMRFVPDEGIPAKELYRLTGLSTKAFRMLLIRMSKWWGYVSVSRLFVRPTPGGLKALQTCRSLTAVIEKRWRERFGQDQMDQFRDAMQSVLRKFAVNYPDYLPILGYELLSILPTLKSRTPRDSDSMCSSDVALPMLLSKLLLAFAEEFERDSGLSLALSANILRLTQDEGVPVQDLPRMSGVSKQAVAMALLRAEQSGLGIVQKSPGEGKIFILTAKGQRAQEKYRELVWDIEKAWKARFGKGNVGRLRDSLESIVGDSPDSSPLLRGLEPYPEGWRGSVPRLERLPHYPMVLHRGGFPDGS